MTKRLDLVTKIIGTSMLVALFGFHLVWLAVDKIGFGLYIFEALLTTSMILFFEKFIALVETTDKFFEGYDVNFMISLFFTIPTILLIVSVVMLVISWYGEYAKYYWITCVFIFTGICLLYSNKFWKCVTEKSENDDEECDLDY